jgi:hypothetical protein
VPMRAKDLETVNELSERYLRTLAAWRALREHGGPLKVGFGSSALAIDGVAHEIELDAHDRAYNELMALLRAATMHQVTDLVDELKTFGVDVSA